MKLTKEYLNGFNNGYSLRKHNPILMKNLEVGLKGNAPYVLGLKDGNKEYEKELNRKLENLQQKSETKLRDQNRDLEL